MKTFEQRITEEWNDYLPNPQKTVRVQRRYGTRTIEQEMVAWMAEVEGTLDGDQRSALREIHEAQKISQSPTQTRSPSYGEVRGEVADDYSEKTKRMLARYNAWEDICTKQGKMPLGSYIVTSMMSQDIKVIGLGMFMSVSTLWEMLKGALNVYLEVKERQAKDKPMRMSLTGRMQECADVIRNHSMLHGEAPTHREIAKAMGYKTTSYVHALTDGLVTRGHAIKLYGHSRSITLL